MSEYKIDYWGAFSSSAWQLLMFAAVAALVAGLVVEIKGETYQSHFSYFVALSEREHSSEFRYDGYYALQSTDLLADTLTGWIMSPEIIARAYEAANLEVPGMNPRALVGSVQAVKKAPQLVEVTIKGEDRSVVERLTVGMQGVIAENVEDLRREGIPAVEFKAMASASWVGVIRLSRPVVAGATFVFVFLIGVNLVLLRESLRSSKSQF